MTAPLDIERFRTLANAYGANLSRWPLVEQGAANLLAAQPEAAMILVEAERLDGILDGWKVAYPPTRLIEGAFLSGTRFGTDAKRRLRIWWAGIGLAAALTGAVAGSMGAVSISNDVSQGYSSTLFGDVLDAED